MKILRSMLRRGSSVETAGYFTVLKPNSWFAASRLQDHPYSLGSRTMGAAEPFSQNPEAPSLRVNLSANHPGWMRVALAILGAIAITLALLWWIMHP